MKRTTILLAVVGLLLLAASALASQPAVIERYVVGGGGGHAEAGRYVLDGTVGQAVVGVAGDAARQLCSGFWCKAAYQVYLPVVLRNG
jgi:hypothetical protein